MRDARRWNSFVLVAGLAFAGCGPTSGSLERDLEGVGAQAGFAPRGDLAIYTIDVGNGDATLILGPEGRSGARTSMLVDAGKLRADGGRIVNAVLDGAGVGALDYVVASHYDADHIGGFVRVLGSESVLWDEGCAPGPHPVRGAIVDLGDWALTSKTIEEYLGCVEATAARGVEHVVVRGGDGVGRTFDLGGGYEAVLVAGDGYVIDQPDRVRYVNTPNESSIAIWVRGPNRFDFLVTGDLVGRRFGSENALAEPVLAEALAARGVDLEVLRLGHHGGANATAPETLVSLQPEVALLSVSAQNDFGHPSCDTYAALQALPIERLVQTQAGATECVEASRLDREVADGTIGVFVEGGGYEVLSLGEVSGATGRATRNFSFNCTVAGGCDDAGALRAPRPGDLYFSEIMTNPAARADSAGEWFELTNAYRDQAFDLSECWVRDDDRDAFTLPEGLLIEGGAAITFARSADAGFTPTHVYGGAMALANSADELELVCDGAVVDRVAWTSSFPLAAGASSSLDPDRGDADTNDDPAVWCVAEIEYATDLGTPNGVNLPCR